MTLENYLEAKHQLMLYTASEQQLNAEIEAILGAIGGMFAFDVG